VPKWHAAAAAAEPLIVQVVAFDIEADMETTAVEADIAEQMVVTRAAPVAESGRVPLWRPDCCESSVPRDWRCRRGTWPRPRRWFWQRRASIPGATPSTGGTTAYTVPRVAARSMVVVVAEEEAVVLGAVEDTLLVLQLVAGTVATAGSSHSLWGPTDCHSRSYRLAVSP